MDKEVIQEVALQLKVLGNSLKDLGLEGFTTYAGWFFRKSVATVVVMGIAAPIMIVLAVLLFKAAAKISNNSKGNDHGQGFVYFFGGVATIAGGICLFKLLYSIPAMIAPEYYALMGLLGK